MMECLPGIHRLWEQSLILQRGRGGEEEDKGEGESGTELANRKERGGKR